MRVFLGLLVGCGPASVSVSDGDPAEPPTGASTGWATDPFEDPVASDPSTGGPDLSAYDTAYARITHPIASEVVPLEEPYTYVVEVQNEAGDVLAGDAVQWFSSADPDFWSDAFTFTSDALAVGTHNLTAIVDLPDGSRVAHEVGDVRVQSSATGTYAGLFSVDGTVQGLVITCTGSALVAIGAQGELGEGDGDCLVSILGIDVPMTWAFHVENQAGALAGEAGVDLLGFFSYDLPMTSGTLDPTGVGLDLTFAGEIPFVGTMSAFLEAPRVSLDAL